MSKPQKSKRAPRAFEPDDPKVVTREQDLPGPELLEAAPDTAPPALSSSATRIPRAMRWGSILTMALTGLVGLAAGAWVSDLVISLFTRQDWIGWASLGLLGLATVSALMIALREAWALVRLRRLGRLRLDAESADRHDDRMLAQRITADLRDLYRSRAELSWARARLGDHEDAIMNARERLTLTERELIRPLDGEARSIVAATAKRVSVITAVSPAAVLDMAVVAAQNLRMLRRVATLYGARPGTIGLFRLARMVLAHIVLTGGIALGDDLIQQLIGHRLVAKLSARLGEGLFNGALTARIGLAAIEVCRPLPFIEVRQPRLRDLIAEIALKSTAKS